MVNRGPRAAELHVRSQGKMAFWGASLPSGKEVSIGEEETEVTITMGSIRDAEKLKNGARVCLLCAPPG